MRKTSKIFLFMALICSLIFCGMMSASALDAKGKCGDNVDYTYNKDTGALVISGKGAMYDYDEKVSPFRGSDITSVTVKKGITKVGAYAFENCNKLEKATITNTVKTMGSKAFYGCKKLATIKMSSKLEKIGNSTFADCSKLESITLADTLKSIGGSAFSGCKSLKSIVIPDRVTTVNSSAFVACSSLETVEIGKSVNSLGLNTFGGCKNLKEFIVDAENKNYVIIDGALLNREMTKVIKYPAKSTRTTFTMPNSVTSTAESVFAGSIYLENIILSENLEKIAMSSFDGCTALKSITIPAKVTNIGYEAFYDCTALQEIKVDKNNTKYSAVNGVLYNKDKTTLILYPEAKTTNAYAVPETVTVIKSRAFYDAKLEKVLFADNLIEISEEAFLNCDNLRSVVMYDSIERIGDDAFAQCPNITSVRYYGTQEKWNEIDIREGNENLLNAAIEIKDDCNCHATGFKGFIYKIQLFFWKLFKLNRVCVCGANHF